MSTEATEQIADTGHRGRWRPQFTLITLIVVTTAIGVFFVMAEAYMGIEDLRYHSPTVGPVQLEATARRAGSGEAGVLVEIVVTNTSRETLSGCYLIFDKEYRMHLKYLRTSGCEDWRGRNRSTLDPGEKVGILSNYDTQNVAVNRHGKKFEMGRIPRTIDFVSNRGRLEWSLR